MNSRTYTAAGVDLDAAQDVKARIGAIVARTHGPQVLGGVGGFGALYDLSGYDEPVLVSSTDGVGTKLKLAIAMERYEVIGEDVVNACVNDVIVTGAKPLFFLDYLALDELRPGVVEALIEGMARACQVNGCALIGGETAQMPGMYAAGEFDVAGFVVGAVERREMLDPSSVREGDVLMGLPSNGLHTNGYSLVRYALGLDDDPAPLWEHHLELGGTLGEALLAPHLPYYPTVSRAMPHLKAAAHVTGGGLEENVPRALPDGLAASIDRSTWTVPPIFGVLRQLCEIDEAEMFRVFNMGIGMVLVCERSRADDVAALAPGALPIGRVVRDSGRGRMVFE